MALEAEDYNKFKAWLKESLAANIMDPDTGKKTDKFALADDKLAWDVINYMQTQLNPETMLGHLTYPQYTDMSLQADAGLYELIFVKHYKEDEDLADKWPLYITASNTLGLLLTRPLNGRDRQLAIEKLRAQTPQNLIQQTR